MEITYVLEQADYWRFRQAVVRRTPALRRQVLGRYLVLPAILAFEFRLLHLAAAVYVALLVLASALWAGYMGWAARRSVARAAALRPGALGLHTMRLDAGGLRERTDCLESSVKWDKVTEVYQSPDHLIVMLSPHYGFLVPVRAFAGPDQAQAFLDTALAYRQAARDGVHPVLPPAPEASWPPPPRTMA